MVTLTDIATAAGVSTSTVSKALRNSSDLNKETIKRIQEIAKEYHYHAKSAESTSQRFSQFVGIICPEARSNFYAQIITHIIALLDEKSIGAMCCFTDFNAEKEAQYVKMLHAQKACGVFCLTEDTDTRGNLSALPELANLPLVQIGINAEANEYDNIYFDDASGIEYAVDHLISLGHRRIAFIGDPYARNRLNSFVKCMNERAIGVREEFLCKSFDRYEQCGYRQIESLLSLEPHPTAVITQYDEIAVGVLRCIYDKGLRVPEDISVIGMENAAYGAYLKDRLTTVGTHIDEISRIAVRLLMNKIENKDYRVVQRVSLLPELIVRETTGLAPK